MRLFLVSFFVLTLSVVAAAGEDHALTVSEASRQYLLEVIVKTFREQLGLSNAVSLSIVEKNKYLVSVQRAEDQKGAFIIKIEAGFLATLTEEEMRAVIAHEMGHIWIFTHHPYLHTEALANQKAAQLVPREELRKVYEKVWKIEGQKDTLAEFLTRVE